MKNLITAIELPFISTWIAKGYISAAMWRFLEIGIYSILSYLIFVAEWSINFSYQWLLWAFIAPIIVALRKYLKDKNTN